jgi:hypothetical protein
MAPWLQVAAPLLELHAALAAHCRTSVLGAQMLRLVVSEDAAGLLAPIASLPATKPDMAAYSAAEVAAVTASLHFAAAVAALISRQPAVNQVIPELSMTSSLQVLVGRQAASVRAANIHFLSTGCSRDESATGRCACSFDR